MTTSIKAPEARVSGPAKALIYAVLIFLTVVFLGPIFFMPNLIGGIVLGYTGSP